MERAQKNTILLPSPETSKILQILLRKGATIPSCIFLLDDVWHVPVPVPRLVWLPEALDPDLGGELVGLLLVSGNPGGPFLYKNENQWHQKSQNIVVFCTFFLVMNSKKV